VDQRDRKKNASEIKVTKALRNGNMLSIVLSVLKDMREII
jgi:hypothetical protein